VATYHELIHPKKPPLTLKSELDMGLFLLTQFNPIHKVAWKSWPNPIQSKNSWY